MTQTATRKSGELEDLGRGPTTRRSTSSDRAQIPLRHCHLFSGSMSAVIRSSMVNLKKLNHKSVSTNNLSSASCPSSSSSPNSLSSSSSSSGSVDLRNLLICGAKNVGKTSLLFTLARGVFPTDDFLPNRFEGWSIRGSANYSQPLPDAGNGGAVRKLKSYSVNLTLWEDRPGTNGFERKLQEKRLLMEESLKALEKEALREDAAVREDKAPLSSGLRIHYPPMEKYKNAAEYTSQLTHLQQAKVKKSGLLATPPHNPNDFDVSKLAPMHYPFPQPDVLVLCYSVDQIGSYRELEWKIWPDIRDRYPQVPVILVATKCDSLSKGCKAVVLDKEELCVLPNSPENMAMWVLDDENELLQEPKKDVLALGCDEESAFVSTTMGKELSKRIGARAYIECSAKEKSGLQHILEEAIWTLMTRWCFPQMGAVVSSVGLAASPVISKLNNHSDSDSPPFIWFNEAPPPSLTNSNSSSISTRGAMNSSSGCCQKRGSDLQLISRPVITIADPFSRRSSPPFNSAASDLTPKQRCRKQSYGATIRKLWSNNSPK